MAHLIESSDVVKAVASHRTPKLGSFVEVGGEGFDLGASGVEGAGAIDGVSGVAQFFVEGKLGGDAAAGFDFAHAASEEAFELLSRSAEGDHESIEIFGEAGFDEQSGFDEDGVAKAGALPRVELQEHGLLDARMENGVEASEFAGVGEDDGGKFGAVDAAGSVGDIGAEFAKDFVVSRLAGFHQTVRDGVGVEYGEAEFAKHGSDGTFAAGDAAG
jgi:hypothetical protein